MKSIKNSCIKCRILHKESIRVSVGLLGKNNLAIAPAFYLCQADICGPFNAYPPVNKRATLKIWLMFFVVP